MNNEFEKRGFKLIDLNLGYEDLMVKTFEEYARANKIQPKWYVNVSPDPIDIPMEYLASIVHKEYTTSIVEKETGYIFKPASWRAPQLKTKKPVRGSIYETSTYEGKAGPYGGWLYQ